MAAGVPQIETERLVMRAWRESDREPYAALNADPVVMEHFPSVMSRAESDAHVDSIQQRWVERGYSLWAVEVRGADSFIGFVGLSSPSWDTSFTPCVEVGWRLSRQHWGNGFAPEAARAALRFGFETLQLDEIVSFTTVNNLNSRRVMTKIGMRRDESDDFDHPALAADSPVLRHVLYRLSRADWQTNR